jgi:hypothetical protein
VPKIIHAYAKIMLIIYGVNMFGHQDVSSDDHKIPESSIDDALKVVDKDDDDSFNTDVSKSWQHPGVPLDNSDDNSASNAPADSNLRILSNELYKNFHRLLKSLIKVLKKNSK